MTIIVVSALGDTPDQLYANARAAAAAHADWVEVRLDGPSGLPWDLRPWFSLDKPALATVRAREDGGRSNADDDVRAEILDRAILAGAHAIDVEFSNEHAKRLIDSAHARGVRVILSLHDLEGTPRVDELEEVLRRMRAMGADFAKLATTVRAPADADALVRAALYARDAGIPAAVMAVNDPFLRLLAPALGLSLVYASAPGQAAAAPGQVAADAVRAAHAKLAPTITGRTRVAYLLGSPVAHSKSPAMQTAAFRAANVDAVFLALDVAPERLASAVDSLRATLGANVTTPHKLAILPMLDELAPSAREAGAVNVVAVQDDRLVGHNTDGDGVVAALHEARVELTGKRALVLGAGGAAQSVVHALRRAGATVRVANRTLDKARALDPRPIAWADVPAMLQRTDVLVNCTSVGMKDDASPVAPTALPSKGLAVLDAVYRPGGSTLIRDARARGLVAIPGEAMLLHQGAIAFELWTGKKAPLDAMRRALA